MSMYFIKLIIKSEVGHRKKLNPSNCCFSFILTGRSGTGEMVKLKMSDFNKSLNCPFPYIVKHGRQRCLSGLDYIQPHTRTLMSPLL